MNAALVQNQTCDGGMTPCFHTECCLSEAAWVSAVELATAVLLKACSVTTKWVAYSRAQWYNIRSTWRRSQIYSLASPVKFVSDNSLFFCKQETTSLRLGSTAIDGFQLRYYTMNKVLTLRKLIHCCALLV